MAQDLTLYGLTIDKVLSIPECDDPFRGLTPRLRTERSSPARHSHTVVACFSRTDLSENAYGSLKTSTIYIYFPLGKIPRYTDYYSGWVWSKTTGYAGVMVGYYNRIVAEITPDKTLVRISFPMMADASTRKEIIAALESKFGSPVSVYADERWGIEHGKHVQNFRIEWQYHSPSPNIVYAGFAYKDLPTLSNLDPKTHHNATLDMISNLIIGIEAKPISPPTAPVKPLHTEM